MCLPVAAALAVAGAVASAGGQIYSGMSANAQGKYEQQVANQNAQLEQRSQRDAIGRQETAQMQHYRRLAQAMGEARVRNSAAGLDVGFGSAAGLENDIALIGYEDSATLAANANKETLGYDISPPGHWEPSTTMTIQQNQPLPAHITGVFLDMLVSPK